MKFRSCCTEKISRKKEGLLKCVGGFSQELELLGYDLSLAFYKYVCIHLLRWKQGRRNVLKSGWAQGVSGKAGHCAAPKAQAGGGAGGSSPENVEKLVLSPRI